MIVPSELLRYPQGLQIVWLATSSIMQLEQNFVIAVTAAKQEVLGLRTQVSIGIVVYLFWSSNSLLSLVMVCVVF